MMYVILVFVVLFWVFLITWEAQMLLLELRPAKTGQIKISTRAYKTIIINRVLHLKSTQNIYHKLAFHGNVYQLAQVTSWLTCKSYMLFYFSYCCLTGGDPEKNWLCCNESRGNIWCWCEYFNWPAFRGSKCQNARGARYSFWCYYLINSNKLNKSLVSILGFHWATWSKKSVSDSVVGRLWITRFGSDSLLVEVGIYSTNTSKSSQNFMKKLQITWRTHLIIK